MENIRYPVYFNNNTCVHCGKTNCLRFKDKYGNIVTKLIYSATKIVCSKCGTEFDIKWIDKNGKM